MPNYVAPPSEPSAGVGTNPAKSSDAVTTGASPAEAKRGRKPLKLERFDGMQIPLETFLAKFQNCQRYNEWTDDECAVFSAIV